MNKKYSFLLAVLAILLTSCNYDYRKSEQGMLYKIFASGSGPVIKQGDFVKIHYVASIGDSVLFNSFEHVPLFGQYDTSYKGQHDFIDILHEMKVGDSAVYVRFVDTLASKGMVQYNNVFKKGSTIKGRMKILERYGSQEEMDAAYQTELEKEKQRETAALEQYAKEKNLEPVTKTRNGILVVVENEGTGPKVDSGLSVTMKYDGYLMNGNKFDSNTDSAFGHVGPFTFRVGTREVIAGWDEGVQYFRQGGKGKLLIPAMLAYGMQSQGDKMPAYSNLVFDIEVVAVNASDTANAAATIPPQGHDKH